MKVCLKSAILVLILIFASNSARCHSQTTCFGADKPAATAESNGTDLPSAKYLNEEQAEIGRNTKLMCSDLFRFVDKKADVAHEASIRPNMKAWTDEERLALGSVIDRIWHIAPGLILQAVHGHKLILFRTTSHPLRYAAVSGPASITFMDSFFSASPIDRLDVVLHELFHQADATDRIAYSAEWMDFCGFDLADIRLKLAFAPSKEKISLLKTERSGSKFPTVYSTNNLKEALAEMGATSILIPSSANAQEFLSRFGHAIMRPCDAISNNDQAYDCAIIAFESHKTKRAIKQMRGVIKSEPKLAMARFHLARMLKSDKKYAAALSEADAAATIFEYNRVPLYDFLFVRQLQIDCALELENLSRLQDLVKDTVKDIPFHRCLSVRFLCMMLEPKRSHIELHDVLWRGAADCYWSIFGISYAKRFKLASANTEFTLSKLTSDTEKYPSNSSAFLRRAHFLEWLGDRESDVSPQTTYYEQASLNYVTANKLRRCAESLLDCCDINLKLKHLEAAQSFQKEAAYMFPHEPESEIMRIQIMDVQGDLSELLHLMQKTFTRTKFDRWMNLAKSRAKVNDGNAD